MYILLVCEHCGRDVARPHSDLPSRFRRFWDLIRGSARRSEAFDCSHCGGPLRSPGQLVKIPCPRCQERSYYIEVEFIR
jgi:DNA-directed RNA polymerase subunit RPC12/RpoP